MIVISTKNRTTTPLAAGATYTGVGEDVSAYGSVRVMLRADSSAPGTLHVGTSNDNVTWTETSYSVTDPSVFSALFVTVSKPYFRLRYVNGGVAQTTVRLQSELYSGAIVGGTGGGGSATVNVAHQRFVLSASNVASKSVTLAVPPLNPSTVTVVPDGGPPQRPGIDFSVTATTLTWSGLGLDGFLDVSDALEVTYYT